MSELQEAAKEFLIESHENLDQLDIDLVGLEQSAAPAEALGRIFRTLHTIKGSCSFLGFPNLEVVAHAGENLLGKLRDGTLALNPVMTDALLRMVDVIRGMLANIENTGQDGNTPHQDLIGLLNDWPPAAPWPGRSWAPALGLARRRRSRPRTLSWPTTGLQLPWREPDTRPIPASPPRRTVPRSTMPRSASTSICWTN